MDAIVAIPAYDGLPLTPRPAARGLATVMALNLGLVGVVWAAAAPGVFIAGLAALAAGAMALWLVVQTLAHRRGIARSVAAAERLGEGPAGDALRAIVQGRRRRPPRAIDADTWIAAGGAAVVCLGVPSPTGGTVYDFDELAEVGTGRSVGRARRFFVLRSGAPLLVLLGAIGVEAARSAGALPLWNWLLVPPVLVLAAGVFVRLGVRPIELASAIAAPGRLNVAFMGRSQEFTPADTVLVVEPANDRFALEETLLVTAVRCDGEIWSCRYAGAADPGYQALVGRWIR